MTQVFSTLFVKAPCVSSHFTHACPASISGCVCVTRWLLQRMNCKSRCVCGVDVTWCDLQDLTMPGSHVDVNLHPTKQEVGFLHQDELLEAIREAVEELLLTSNDK